MGSKYIMYMTLGTKSWVKIFMPSYHKNPLSLNPFVSRTSPAVLTWHINPIMYSVLSCLYSIRFFAFIVSWKPFIRFYLYHVLGRQVLHLLLAHLSWRFKWAFLIKICPLSVIIIVINFTFSSSSPEPLGQFQPNLAQSILGWRGFKFVQIKGHALLQREIIVK